MCEVAEVKRRNGVKRRMVVPYPHRKAMGSINRFIFNFKFGWEKLSSFRLTCDAQHERQFTDSEEALWCSHSSLGVKRRDHCVGTTAREVACYFASHLNEPLGLMESGESRHTLAKAQ